MTDPALRRLAWRLFVYRQYIWFLKRAGFSPSTAVFRRWYDLVTELAGRVFGGFRCMNYGLYAEPAHFAGWPEEDLLERYPLRLYESVAGGAGRSSFAGLDAAEIGSGRGGGAAFLARRLAPRRMTGVELSPAALRSARAAFAGRANLEFLEGDAERLPFESASIDVALNIESSHCYPGFERFLSEIRRVLRPGGVLLLADFRPAAGIPAFRQALAECGLRGISDRDITAGVAEALEADSARKERIIDSSGLPGFARGAVRGFAGCAGTKVYRMFHDGSRRYLSLALRKDPGD